MLYSVMTSLAVYDLLDYKGLFVITAFRHTDLSIYGNICIKYN